MDSLHGSGDLARASPSDPAPPPRSRHGRPVSHLNEWLYETWFLDTGHVHNGVRGRQCRFCARIWRHGKPADLWQHTAVCQGTQGTEQGRTDAKSKARELRVERENAAAAPPPAQATTSGDAPRKLKTHVDRPVADAQKKEGDRLLVRALVSLGVPFSIVDNREVQTLIRWLRPSFHPSSRRLSAPLGEEFSAAVMRNCAKVKLEELGVTVGAHTWSNCRMEPIIDVNVVLGSSRKSVLWHSEDMHASSHTGDGIAQLLMAQIRQLEGQIDDQQPTKRVVMLCTDNASDMRQARKLVVQTPGFMHIVECSCVLHALALGMAAIIRQPEVHAVITDVQKVAAFVRASQLLDHNQGLQASTKTRLTSVYECLSSFVPMKHVFQSMILLDERFLDAATEKKDGDGKQLLAPAGVERIRALMAGELFWAQAAEITELLQPFVQVLTMVQSNKTTLADVQRYWLYLAQSLERRLMNEASSLSAGCRSDIGVHFNMRLEEMGSKLGRLALFLDPYHRGLVLTDADTMLEVRVTAGKFWAARGYSQGEVLALSTEMRAYEAYMAPYNQGLGKPGFDGVMTYWKALVGASPQLASLALLVFSMRPQAAGAERDFSVFGSIHSDALSRLHSANAHTVAIIKRAIQADGPPAEGRHQKKARLTVDQHEAAQGGASGSEAEPSADADPGDDDDSIDLTEAELAAGVASMNDLLDKASKQVAAADATDTSAAVARAFAGLKTLRAEADPLEVHFAEPAKFLLPAQPSQGAAGFDVEALLRQQVQPVATDVSQEQAAVTCEGARAPEPPQPATSNAATAAAAVAAAAAAAAAVMRADDVTAAPSAGGGNVVPALLALHRLPEAQRLQLLASLLQRVPAARQQPKQPTMQQQPGAEDL